MQGNGFELLVINSRRFNKETDALEMTYQGLGEIIFLKIYGSVKTVAFVLKHLFLILIHKKAGVPIVEVNK